MGKVFLAAISDEMVIAVDLWRCRGVHRADAVETYQMTVDGVFCGSTDNCDQRGSDACARLLEHCTTDLGYRSQKVTANRRLSSVEDHI